jgi:hypothetical protein
MPVLSDELMKSGPVVNKKRKFSTATISNMTWLTSHNHIVFFLRKTVKRSGEPL